MTPDVPLSTDNDVVALLGDETRHREGLLALAAGAVSAGHPLRALRYIDRARRLSPGDTTLALLFARLLGQTGRPDEGVRALERVSARGHWAAHGLLKAELLLQAGEVARAGEVLGGLAGLFALEALPRFGEIAEAVCAAAPDRWRGWLAFAANGALIGALTGEAADRSAVLLTPPADLQRVLESLPDRTAVIGGGQLRWPPAWRLDA